MNRIELLPIWTLSDGIPSVYDTTSGTYQEMVAKVYGAMRNLQLDYNSFANEINDAITKYINVDQQTFKDEITKIVHNYIVMIDTAIDHQDRVINENITYIKHNLATEVTSVISEMKDSGELDIIIGDAIGGLGERIEALENQHIPTNVSDLNNDLQYATQDYVDNEIATFDFIKVVDELPAQGLENRIYFVPKSDSQTQDLFDEYAWINNKWEWITTKQIEVDLTPYYKKTEVYNKGEIDNTITEIEGSITEINGTLPQIFKGVDTSNGYYIKGDDGTLICSKTVEVETAMTAPWGSMYASADVSLGNYPIDFIDVPKSVHVQSIEEPACFIAHVKNRGKSKIGDVILLRPVSSTNAKYKLSIYAIGRWK